MSEQETLQLYGSLTRSREAFMSGRNRVTESNSVRRKSQRDRELNECFRNR
ncbi:hypothetical protein SAMN05216522_10139 [Rosenbergiella nectarea]|uniref:Uncharacterized protein n=1 Tax=Rosenbergiella nectarea TaxID=988801 RepID=A0A1H9CWV2_9GAMM|nr:hypothetical protein SAMN05216522_10139 [Rosenbergiella nectarea]